MTRDGKRLGEQQMGLSKALRNVDPTNYITEVIKTSACELLGKPHLQIPPTGHEHLHHPTCLTHTSPIQQVAPYLHYQRQQCSGESKLWQTFICKSGRDHKLELYHHLWETNDRLSALGLVHYRLERSLRILP